MRFLNKQLTLAIALIFIYNTSVFAERWSRQLTPDLPATANDWVPIRHGKSISFEDDLTPAAQTPFQFFADPLNNRFNQQQGVGAPSEINNFAIQNPPPPFQFVNQPQKQRTVQNFGGSVGNKPQAEPLVQNPPQFQYMQEIQRGPHVHHYQSQPIPKALQNFQHSQPNFPPFTGQSRLPPFQKISPPHFQQVQQQQQQPPPQFQPQFQQAPSPPQFQPLQNEQQPQSEEQVQLLYVPYDSLYQQGQQQQPQQDFGKQNRFNLLNQPVSASLINDFYSQNEVQEFPTKPATTKNPITTRRPTISPVTSSLRPTTPFAIEKPKPHQPPLSMFVAIDKFKGKATEADVLSTLKNSNSIDVMDSITKNSPKVFIGPSGMAPPAGYSKFDLPYLSNIEGTRFERKIEQLPFFVAPLSYRTPPGFSKIPLPAPHVGSVVVNQPPNSLDNNESNGFTPDNYYTKQTSTNDNFFAKQTSAGPTHDNFFTKQPSIGPTVQTGSTIRSSPTHQPNNQPKNQKVLLTTGFNYSPDGNVQLIRNEYTFPTLSPSAGTAPSFESQSRSVFTTQRPTFAAHTASPSTAETPLTKVAYKHIEEKRNYGQSTNNPTTTRTPITKTNLDYFPTSPRSTARAPTTKATFTELDEHKTVNEEYYGFEKEKRPTFGFKFGTEVDKPSANFNFRPIPEFDFGDTDYVTTRKPKTKAPTTQFSFPSSTPLPSPSFDYSPTVSVIENSDIFGGSDGNFFEFRSTPRPSSTQQDFGANRFSLGNEQTFTQDTAYTPQQYSQDNSDDVRDETTDNPNYALPSELPPISPQLPGWVNSLMEDKWMQKTNVTEDVSTTTTSTTTTRRPINRGSRRPVTSGSRSTATDSTVERRPVTRRSRPTTFTSRNSVGTTEPSTFPSRGSTVTRGSKVKYNSTSDERSKFRTRNRVPVKKEEENIEYQRDVLNQNYPSSVRPLDGEATTTERTVEGVHIHNEQYSNSDHIVNDYNTPLESVEVIPLGGNSDNTNDNSYTRPHYFDNTIETSTLTTTSTTTPEAPLPSNHKHSSNSFVGLQEPLQVPNHKTVAHRLKGNFNYKHRNIDSFYNTNLHDSTTQKPEHDDDEISITVPTTQATTRATTVADVTEAPIPRRTNFPRRRLPYTTTEAPSTDSESTEAYGVRFEMKIK